MVRETPSRSVQELEERRKKAALSILEKNKDLIPQERAMLKEYTEWLANGRPSVDVDTRDRWERLVDALRKRLNLQLSAEEKHELVAEKRRVKKPFKK